jgi:catalase
MGDLPTEFKSGGPRDARLFHVRIGTSLDDVVQHLGGPNFTNLPINAPKCPFRTLQQDGHMALVNPKSRVNYEPNSWAGAEAGPREDPGIGFHSYPAEEAGPKLRVRAESFADHYSQARQFYISQTLIEQTHIAHSFTFELSKVDRPEIRARMVSQLLNVDDGLAEKVATGLGLQKIPKLAAPAKPTRTDLQPSPALSILLNCPATFEGRKVGALMTNGVESALLMGLKKALDRRAQRWSSLRRQSQEFGRAMVPGSKQIRKSVEDLRCFTTRSRCCSPKRELSCS